MAEKPTPKIWDQSAEGAKVSDGDPVAHSPAALKVLTEQGEAAWRKYVLVQRARKARPKGSK